MVIIWFPGNEGNNRKGLGSVMVLCVVGRCLAGKLFKCGGKRVSVIEPTFERKLF